VCVCVCGWVGSGRGARSALQRALVHTVLAFEAQALKLGSGRGGQGAHGRAKAADCVCVETSLLDRSGTKSAG
jgi:hypothetical protein